VRVRVAQLYLVTVCCSLVEFQYAIPLALLSVSEEERENEILLLESLRSKGKPAFRLSQPSSPQARGVWGNICHPGNQACLGQYLPSREPSVSGAISAIPGTKRLSGSQAVSQTVSQAVSLVLPFFFFLPQLSGQR
jgi:hypothetical protein